MGGSALGAAAAVCAAPATRHRELDGIQRGALARVHRAALDLQNLVERHAEAQLRHDLARGGGSGRGGPGQRGASAHWPREQCTCQARRSERRAKPWGARGSEQSDARCRARCCAAACARLVHVCRLDLLRDGLQLRQRQVGGRHAHRRVLQRRNLKHRAACCLTKPLPSAGLPAAHRGSGSGGGQSGGERSGRGTAVSGRASCGTTIESTQRREAVSSRYESTLRAVHAKAGSGPAGLQCLGVRCAPWQRLAFSGACCCVICLAAWAAPPPAAPPHRSASASCRARRAPPSQQSPRQAFPSPKPHTWCAVQQPCG